MLSAANGPHKVRAKGGKGGPLGSRKAGCYMGPASEKVTLLVSLHRNSPNPRPLRMYLGPLNSQVLRPRNTFGESNGGVGSCIESARSLWDGQFTTHSLTQRTQKQRVNLLGPCLQWTKTGKPKGQKVKMGLSAYGSKLNHRRLECPFPCSRGQPILGDGSEADSPLKLTFPRGP